MTDDELRERLLAIVRERGPVSTRKVRAAVPARAKRVDEALSALRPPRKSVRTRDGWMDVRNDGTRVPRAGRGLTAAELEAITLRSERVRAIWSALSPRGRERALAGLSDEQRAAAVAMPFEGHEIGPSQGRWTA